MATSGADSCEYSVRPWCSPSQQYFQLCLSAKIAYSASCWYDRCCMFVSCAAGPGMNPLRKMANSMGRSLREVGLCAV
jgi:hypothetical protein